MSQSVITTAFEQLKAEQAANGGVLTLDEFVFANVPDLNITDPIDRGESWPLDEQIVHRQDVSKTGTVNGNAVVYSVVLGADVGDFDFNWIGLINKASNTVAMIVHAPSQKKIKTASGQQGNVLTRSFMMEYNGASQITQITTPADTWQIDFTARLAGMDERIRKENIDTYGVASFYHDGFLVRQENGDYSVKKGVGYVGGLRAELLLDKEITAAELPVKVWVDVCWKGLLTSVWDVETKIAVAETLNDYSDNGQQHYVFAVAEIQADGSVSDLRGDTIKKNQDIIQDLKEKQPLHETLTELSGLQVEANTLPFFNAGKKMQLTDVTELARTILKRETSGEVLSDLGLASSRMMVITSSQTVTTLPSWVTEIRVSACAAGGGGGSGATNNGGQSSLVGGGGGGGGGAGESILRKKFIITAGDSLSVTVGSGGNGGLGATSGGGNDGGSGGGTSITGLFTLVGGNGGYGGGPVQSNSAGNGGAGGIGGDGFPTGSSGGDGNYAGNGGAGASAPFGGGGGGARAVKTNPNESRFQGQPGGGYGSGGGGSGGSYGSQSALSSYAGGKGSPGIVIIEW